MEGLERTGCIDVVRDLAIPLPVTLISEILGVESERHADFKRWSDAVIEMTTGAARRDPVGSGLLEVFSEMFRYLRDAARARRESPRDDLLGLLVDPAQESTLSELEVVLFVVLLLVAGNETTTNLIGNAVNALLDHPEALERVAAEPALVPALVEETRSASPESVAWMLYLGAFPTALAFTTWAFALSRTTAGRLGSTTYLVPAIAIFLGWFILGEAPPAVAMLGGAIAIGGVVIARSRPSRRAVAPTPAPAQR